jgi:CIC family chloride channel protein
VTGERHREPAPPTVLLPSDLEHVRLLIRWAVVAVVFGVISGCVVHGIRELLLLLVSLRRLSPGPLFFTLPAIGAAINGFGVYRLDREARGDGLYTYIKVAGDSRVRLGFRFVLLKILATLATIGSGARGGLVGPLVAIHAGIGVTLARWFPFFARFVSEGQINLRPSAICGAAGAVGALLLAPLGGGIFAVEILFGGALAYAALFPAILTSTTAFFVSAALRGACPRAIWTRPEFSMSPSGELLILVLASSVIAGVVGILFVFLPVLSLFVLMVGIALAVGFVVGGSGSGGLTMPAMTIGVLSGALVAGIFSVPPAESLPLLVAGMTACLASSLNVPIAAAVISLEVFGAGTAYAAVLGSVIGYQIGRGHLMYRYLKRP